MRINFIQLEPTAAALPRDLAARAFAPAWALALALHAALLGAALLAPRMVPPLEEPLVRLVFVEPPPPPAAALGSTGASGAERTAVRIPADLPPEPARTTVAARPRVPRVRRAAAPTAPIPDPAPAPAEADAAPGVAAGIMEGRAGGVVGGSAAGLDGGTLGGTGTGPVPAAQMAHPPVLVHRVPPVYPRIARRRNVGGLVLLQAVLDEQGRVEPDVEVLESIPLLDEEAIAAVRQWRFRPARNGDGETRRVILEIPIRFVLE